MADDPLIVPNGEKPPRPPSFQFYPGDWRRDLALQSCSLRARGLWHEMICLMHEGVPYGYLTTAAGPITPKRLAQLVHTPLATVVRDLAELEEQAVFSRTPEGWIYSRRMVRDQTLRTRRAMGGYKSIGHPHTHPPRVTGRVPFEPPPSSSSAKETHPETTGARTMPDDLSITRIGELGDSPEAMAAILARQPLLRRAKGYAP